MSLIPSAPFTDLLLVRDRASHIGECLFVGPALLLRFA
jgi:hypothetical protein